MGTEKTLVCLRLHDVRWEALLLYCALLHDNEVVKVLQAFRVRLKRNYSRLATHQRAQQQIVQNDLGRGCIYCGEGVVNDHQFGSLVIGCPCHGNPGLLASRQSDAAAANRNFVTPRQDRQVPLQRRGLDSVCVSIRFEGLAKKDVLLQCALSNVRDLGTVCDGVWAAHICPLARVWEELSKDCLQEGGLARADTPNNPNQLTTWSFQPDVLQGGRALLGPHEAPGHLQLHLFGCVHVGKRVRVGRSLWPLLDPSWNLVRQQWSLGQLQIILHSQQAWMDENRLSECLDEDIRAPPETGQNLHAREDSGYIVLAIKRCIPPESSQDQDAGEAEEDSQKGAEEVEVCSQALKFFFPQRNDLVLHSSLPCIPLDDANAVEHLTERCDPLVDTTLQYSKRTSKTPHEEHGEKYHWYCTAKSKERGVVQSYPKKCRKRHQRHQ
mmetsp:Transcript_44585/g.128993  ORF Transcript_44585/g.128993 Transcript_44585/m.128993 type:complete len:439 (+) Transcript_44585:2210-3526(+)